MSLDAGSHGTGATPDLDAPDEASLLGAKPFGSFTDKLDVLGEFPSSIGLPMPEGNQGFVGYDSSQLYRLIAQVGAKLEEQQQEILHPPWMDEIFGASARARAPCGLAARPRSLPSVWRLVSRFLTCPASPPARTRRRGLESSASPSRRAAHASRQTEAARHARRWV